MPLEHIRQGTSSYSARFTRSTRGQSSMVHADVNELAEQRNIIVVQSMEQCSKE